MVSLRIKKGDKVIVTVGKDKGKVAEVLKVDKNAMQVLLKGINIKKLHRKSDNNSQGGILEVERPIDISNVSHISEGKPARTKYVFDGDKKSLVFKSSGKEVRS